MFSMVLVTGATIGGCKDPWETQKSDSQTGLMWIHLGHLFPPPTKQKNLLHTLAMVTGFKFKVNFSN